MRRYSIPDQEAAAKILPKSRKDRRTLWSIGGFLGLIVILVVGVLVSKHKRQQEIETWQRAVATIEDVRPVVVSQVNSQLGGCDALSSGDIGTLQREWLGTKTMDQDRA
jgi:hypothetical protein